MSAYIVEDERKVTTLRLREMKKQGRQVAMLTSYDFTMAGIVDKAGVDIILVGDSASNVMQGNLTTVPITLDEMIVYARGVARAAQRAMVVSDMPFGTYHASREDGVKNAVRLMQKAGVDGLKLEGGREIMDTVKGILDTGIPVMGHLGLTPQSVYKFGGYGLRAKEQAEADKLVEDAMMLEKVGCFALVLEKIPSWLTAKVCDELSIPVIGIGAGPADGQVLVLQDMLGMNKGFKPKFLRHYADLYTQITDAVGQYVTDVKSGSYPNENEWY